MPQFPHGDGGAYRRPAKRDLLLKALGETFDDRRIGNEALSAFSQLHKAQNRDDEVALGRYRDALIGFIRADLVAGDQICKNLGLPHDFVIDVVAETERDFLAHTLILKCKGYGPLRKGSHSIVDCRQYSPALPVVLNKSNFWRQTPFIASMQGG